MKHLITLIISLIISAIFFMVSYTDSISIYIQAIIAFFIFGAVPYALYYMTIEGVVDILKESKELNNKIKTKSLNKKTEDLNNFIKMCNNNLLEERNERA